MPGTCVAKTIGTDGNECPAQCPLTCGPEELYCPGTSGSDGCPAAATCLAMKLKKKDKQGGRCSNHCPATCADNELKCSGGFDPASGCPMPDMCRRVKKKCPRECPLTCAEGEMHCPGWDHTSGCELPGTCVAKTNGTDGSECPPQCPPQCDPGSIVCA